MPADALGAGAAFLTAAPPIPLNVPITVLFAGSFFAIGFRTTVPLLVSLESLIVRALPLVARVVGATGAGVGAAALFPLTVAGFTSATFLVSAFLAVSVFFAAVALRAAAPRVAFAFSTMFVRSPAAPPDGTCGLSGETGRVRTGLV